MASARERREGTPSKPWQRYYVDKYDKCENCGKLLYGEGFTVLMDARPRRFCSAWCEQWYIKRRGDGIREK